MKVFVDLDDTAALLSTKWLAAIQNELGETILSETVTTWERLAPRKYQDILRTPEFFRNLPVMNYAAETLLCLAKHGDEIYILSAGAPWNYADKAAWVQEHLPFIPHTHVLFATPKHLLATPDRLLIDDGPHNLEAWKQAGGITIAYDRPWNQAWEGLRLKSWSELPNLLDRLEAGAA